MNLERGEMNLESSELHRAFHLYMLKIKILNTNKRYDDEQKTTFVELAAQIGIGRAIRELGYPSYPVAQAWCRARGVEPNVDNAYAQIKEWHTFYQVEDLLIVIDEGISVARDMMLTAHTPDDIKRLAESIQKLTNTRLLLEGKATTIKENRDVSEDSEFNKALKEFYDKAEASPGVAVEDHSQIDI